MNNVIKGLVAICLLGIGSAAGATSVDLGTIAAGDSAGDSLTSGAGASIADQWTFTLDQNLLTAISVDANDSVPFFEISDFVVSSSSAAISFVYDAADNSYAFDGTLAAGTYTFDVSGLVTGDIAGQYEVLVGTAVPVPAAVWLFGSALLGLLASRRRTFTA